MTTYKKSTKKMAFIEAEGVAKKFDDFWALKEVNFSANKGDFLTLLGPSGCGKSTLLNLIAGFLLPTSGSIKVDGNDISHLTPENRDSAMCFQSYALFPHLSVLENIAFGPKQKKVPNKEVVKRLNSLMQQVDLTEHKDKLPNQLSGGQQQRVALARALAVQPSLVLFDEPLSNLDAKLRDQVRIEIRALQKELGFTAIYVTHDQSEALAMSDKVLLLNNGVIEQEGTPEEVYFSPQTEFVANFIGAANVHRVKINSIKNSVISAMLGTELVEFDSANHKDLKVGQEISICWRPEVARLWTEKSLLNNDNRYNKIRAKFVSSAFQGAYTDVFIKIKGQEKIFRLQLPRCSGLKTDQEISFSLPKDSILIIEKV